MLATRARADLQNLNIADSPRFRNMMREFLAAVGVGMVARTTLGGDRAVVSFS
jgi:hypothetical protein